MNVILDYDVGNLESVRSGFSKAGIETIVSRDPLVLSEANLLILPGVGAFGDAMDALRRQNLIAPILAHVAKNKPLFGICLGMQLLYETGYEHGTHAGLGLLKGDVVLLQNAPKIPHMGWNQLSFDQPNNLLLQSIHPGDHVYFVHSYYVRARQEDVVASTNYGLSIPAIVQSGPIVATQFHPEKSGAVGLSILKAYAETIR
jgi:glutamine amidotransferase